jgi:two-component system CheB/CheR fusion protein
VGIGASVGGMEAFEELLGALPREPGMALLFVQHLEPHQKSHLSEILARRTELPVSEAHDGMPVETNHIYVIAPNTVMTFAKGRLALVPRMRGQHMPIDHLFRSLAAELKSGAIGVLLSGGGTDGTLGFQSIKAEGGITFAQDEKSAKQDSMPRSAILDGCVDYVLPPKDIGPQLIRLVNHAYAQGQDSPHAGGDPIGRIVEVVRSLTDVDFTHYKRSTIRRRVQRRMALRGIESYDHYLDVLRQDVPELNNLYQDFLIRVTQFFRDPEAYEALKERVFPALLNERSVDRPVRVWVTGCSTGEEVYSLAIALLEYLGGKEDAVPIKILATDLNEAALEKARAGVYIDNIEADVSPDRLRRFFARSDGYYRISKALRELCVFSRHNLIKDPPFSHLDLVSCRNVLIYLDLPLQKRVLPILHYALNPNGFLFLGSSESIGTFPDLFNVVDAKHRVFAKKQVVANVPLDFGAYSVAEGARPRREEPMQHWSALDVQKEADRIVLARFAPVGVIVDETMNVLQFRGRTSAFLEPAPGMASLDLYRMLREGLLADVRAALNAAKSENNTVTREAVRVGNGGEQRVRIEVIPFKLPVAGARFFLVLFQDQLEAQAAAPPQVRAEPSGSAQQAAQLQQELTALREYLQSVIEEQESTNEELKSANEEILSANEELQSTNEELQTAKEEAQSANEELATVNEELRHRNTELGRANNDLVNILSGVNIPIILVDRNLAIRRFTPPAEKICNLIATDVGRPISDIKPNLKIVDLSKLISQVIDTLTAFEDETQDKDGHWYSLRIRPYVTMDNKIDGASVVLVDIDSIKRTLMEQMKQQSPQGQ